MAVVQLKMFPDQFWSMTPYEFKLMLRRHKSSHERDMEMVGVHTWYTGIAGNCDYRKTNFRRWMESFQDPEKVKARREKEMSKGKELWQQLNGGKL